MSDARTTPLAAPRRRAARRRDRLVGVLPLARPPRCRPRCGLARAARRRASATSSSPPLVIQVVYVAQAARWRLIAGTLELTVQALLRARARRDRREQRPAAADRRPPPRPLARDLGRRSRPGAPSARSSATAPATCSRSSSRSPSRCRSSAMPTWVERIAVGGLVLLVVPRARRRRGASSTRARGRGPGGRLAERARRLVRDTIDEVASPIGRRRLVARARAQRRRLGRLGASPPASSAGRSASRSHRSSSSSSPP